MHERKRLMFERADAFVALPGGIGTLEELVEQLTWAQLGRHKKPILLANIDGFWDPLLRAARPHAATRVHPRRRSTVDLLVADRVEDILPKLRSGRGASVAEARRQNWRSGRSPRRAAAERFASSCSLAETSPPRCGCRRDRG